MSDGHPKLTEIIFNFSPDHAYDHIICRYQSTFIISNQHKARAPFVNPEWGACTGGWAELATHVEHNHGAGNQWHQLDVVVAVSPRRPPLQGGPQHTDPCKHNKKRFKKWGMYTPLAKQADCLTA